MERTIQEGHKGGCRAAASTKSCPHPGGYSHACSNVEEAEEGQGELPALMFENFKMTRRIYGQLVLHVQPHTQAASALSGAPKTVAEAAELCWHVAVASNHSSHVTADPPLPFGALALVVDCTQATYLYRGFRPAIY